VLVAVAPRQRPTTTRTAQHGLELLRRRVQRVCGCKRGGLRQLGGLAKQGRAFVIVIIMLPVVVLSGGGMMGQHGRRWRLCVRERRRG
jgi:hypothetical protein